MGLLRKLLLSFGIILNVFVLSACHHEETPIPLASNDGDAVLRGKEIATGMGACGFCHSVNGKPGARLSGGRNFEDVYGNVVAPNITLGEGGLEGWSESEVLSVFRNAKGKDGRELSVEAHRGLEWLSDQDASALIAYLRSLPPVNNDVERRSLGLYSRNTAGLLEKRPDVTGFVPEISRTYGVQYGNYLADHVARCAACHNSPSSVVTDEEYWAGGKSITFDGESKTAPNITSSKTAGIGNWSTNDLQRFFDNGKTPDGHTVDTRFCPVEFFKRANKQDRQALIAYIQTVAPLE